MRASLRFLGLVAGCCVAVWSGCGLISAPDREKIAASNAGGTAGAGGSGGEGGAGTCSSASDCEGVDTDCAAVSCDDGMCGTTNTAAGEACSDSGGSVCDGDGNCVGCLVDEDCDALEVCDTTTNECVAGPCGNGVQDGQETGVDCGGPDCEAGCEDGDACLVPDDCDSRYCESGVCSACLMFTDCQLLDYCKDGDCIPREMNGTACSGGTECLSANCVDGVCCSTPCAGTCQNCNLMGSVGSCQNYPDGMDPEDECAGTDVCNGGSACRAP